MKICSNCGQQFNDEMSFCPKCGVRLSEEPKEYFCPTCGKSLGETYESFCPYCGQSFEDSNHRNEHEESDSVVKENNSKGILKGLLILFGAIIVFGMCGSCLFGGKDTLSKSNNAQKDNSGSAPVITTGVKDSKSIPNDFVPVNVLDQIMYVPKEFKKSEMQVPSSNSGIALVGNVWKKGDNSKDSRPDVYDVAVMFEKSADLRTIKPYEEDQALELIFKNAWDSMQKTAKVAKKRELYSKAIRKSFDGHKYLKAVIITGNPYKPNLDMIDKMGIYIFDDTIYVLSVAERASSNGKYAEEIDTILDAFGVRK